MLQQFGAETIFHIVEIKLVLGCSSKKRKEEFLIFAPILILNFKLILIIAPILIRRKTRF
jgi:hypothetical protein